MLAIGDLILAEVLQGFDTERNFKTAQRLLSSFVTIELGGAEIALRAARNFRTLRGLGFTIRKTINTIIATRCIESNHALLYSDRDFDPFVKHLGLQSALSITVP